MSEYISKAIPTSIKATSKCTVKLKDNYYSIEFTEERSIPDVKDIDIEIERTMLFEDANKVVDNQIKEILNNFK